MGKNFKIADNSDAEILVELMQEFYEVEHLKFDENTTRALATLLNDEALGRVWLIQDGNEAIGYVVLTFGYSLEFRGRDAFVDELYIRESYRGQGVGTSTLQFVEGVCPSLGIEALHLEVDRKNTVAQSLYRKIGFADHDRYLMTKWIEKVSSTANLDPPVFELKDVTKQFGRFQSLTDINLKIWAGDRVALVGPSGAGKSTLISLLNGMLLPSKGEVWVLGRNLTQLRPKLLRQVQRQIGTIYQQFYLVDNLRVIHNVNAGHLGRWSFPKAAVSLIWPLEVETAAKALAQVGILEKLYERTDRLSGGQQQRVAIARVLVQNPTAILADEPISSLDPERSREIMDLLRQLSQEHGKTLVTSLHAIEFARSHYQRIIGLRQGHILFDTPAQSLSSEMIEELYKTHII